MSSATGATGIDRLMDVRVQVLAGWRHPGTRPDRRRPRWVFRNSWAETAELLTCELDHLGARSVLIGVGLTGRDIDPDGWLSARDWPAAHPGVELSFTDRDGARLDYATDACELWQHNVRSIALGLGALRAVDRYGITRRQQQYAGFRTAAVDLSARPGRGPERRVLPDRRGGPDHGVLPERQLVPDRRRVLDRRVTVR